VLSDHNVERTVETIRKSGLHRAARRRSYLHLPGEDVVRIRTGERGREALTYAGDIDDRADGKK